jgi:hypothetical protein
MLDFAVAALSVTDKIKDAGSYAGFACVLGLAVLSVLYFAQARELKRLREWAGRAPERAAEMQERIQQGAVAPQQADQRRVVAQPVPRVPAAAPATPAGATAAGQPRTPAPGTAAAPGTVPAAAPAVPGAPAPGTAGAATATPGAVPPAGAVPAPTNSTPADDQATQAIPAVPAAAVPAPRPQPAVPLRSTPPASASPPLRRAGQQEAEPAPSPARTTLAVVGGGLAVILVAILLITQVFGGGDDSGPTASVSSSNSGSTTSTGTTGSTPKSSSTPKTSAAPPVVRRNFTVSVVNGTSVTGAAREASTKVETAGYKIGATKQGVTNTVEKTNVYYQPKSKAAALDVAQQLGLSPATVIPADANTIITGEQANVIVILGSDTVKSPSAGP